MPRVVILVHRHGTLDDPTGYTLRHIVELWREDGIEVTIQHGPGPVIDADVAIQHVDLTRVPLDHLAYMRQFPVAINGRQADISKSVVSHHIVRPGDGWTGPVMVKTEMNCGGWKEAELASRGLLPASAAKVLADYPIFDSASEVPDAVWQDSSLVVDRFQPERDGDEFVLRQWQFFGDQEYGRKGWCDSPVIKAGKQKRTEEIFGVPDRLREIREELAFDFGRFDYGIVDGEVVLWDANRTPTMGPNPSEERRGRIRFLADGIKPYLSSVAR